MLKQEHAVSKVTSRCLCLIVKAFVVWHSTLTHFLRRKVLIDIRFKLPEIKLICDMLEWNVSRTRNQYICKPMVVCSTLLFRLATTQRCYDTELKFGMYSSQISEIFLGCRYEFLVQKFDQKLDLRGSSLMERAEQYAGAFRDAGALFVHYIGFMDCAKIRIQRLEGRGSNQRHATLTIKGCIA